MNKTITFSFLLLIYLIFFSPLFPWPVENGVAVCTVQNNQSEPQIISDGEGGAIIVWNDNRDSTSSIYGQRIDLGGNIIWNADGMPICTTGNNNYYQKSISDSLGGSIITWTSFPGDGDSNILAQRIDPNGLILWVSNGINICTSTNRQYYPNIISDGEGGAIITWYDYRSTTNFPTQGSDIYAQRINGAGSTLWTLDGVAICTAIGNQITYYVPPQLISDNLGGAIISWEDYRNDVDIFAQRVNSMGSTLWATNGIAICTSLNNQKDPKLVEDGNGGAIITWDDDRNGDSDIYSQRITSLGSTLWIINGVQITNSTTEQVNPFITIDGLGGAYISWQEDFGYKGDIYAQRLNGNGIKLWDVNGIAICTAQFNQWEQLVYSDGLGGAFFLWNDSREYIYGNTNIYIQHVKSSGNIMWNLDGYSVCSAPKYQFTHQLIPDGQGGAIIVWEDYRNDPIGELYSPTNKDIYTQRVYVNGSIYPPSSITKTLWEYFE